MSYISVLVPAFYVKETDETDIVFVFINKEKNNLRAIPKRDGRL